MCCCCNKKDDWDEVEDNLMFDRGFSAGEHYVVSLLKQEIGKTHKDAPIPQATILFWLGLNENGEKL